MFGAIVGDVVGSRFEFDRGPWVKEFDFLTYENMYTDDSVMTVAIAEALLNAGKFADIDEIKTECIKSMKKWGQKYPHAGYGSRFYSWVLSEVSKPYGSYGNGSAMRVSAVGWLYDTLDRTREVARATAEVTHNHPEGIKGAECTAAVMFLARTGVAKEEIKDFVIKEFGYDVSKTLGAIRPLHKHDESCMDALPKALVSFFEGNDFEDVIRNAVSLGGDTDTIAAIAGAMAEAFYGIPIMYLSEILGYVESDMIEVINTFERVIKNDSDDEIEDLDKYNKFIKMAVEEAYKERTTNALIMVLEVLRKRILEEGAVPTPMVDKNNAVNLDELMNSSVGDELLLEKEMHLVFDTMRDDDGIEWFPLFTDEEELYKGQTANIIMKMPIIEIIKSGFYSDRVNGIVINPFGTALTFNKEALKVLIDLLEDVEP